MSKEMINTNKAILVHFPAYTSHSQLNNTSTAQQPISGHSNGKLDPTNIPDSTGPQAPTTDPLYANANRRT